MRVGDTVLEKKSRVRCAAHGKLRCAENVEGGEGTESGGIPYR
jgi:hypothetical protein